MFAKKLKSFLTQIKPHAKPAQGTPYIIPWVFYGWLAAGVVAILMFAGTIFLLYHEVYSTIQLTALATQYQQSNSLADINLTLFEKTRERWEAKKQLPVKRPVSRNPFQSSAAPEPEEPLTE